MIVSRATELFPVCLSPIINSRCPLPTGIIASIEVIPVWIGSQTDLRAIIPGAIDSISLDSSPLISPFPSIACPKPSTTLPRKSLPTIT